MLAQFIIHSAAAARPVEWFLKNEKPGAWAGALRCRTLNTLIVALPSYRMQGGYVWEPRVPDVSRFKIPDYKYVAAKRWGKRGAVVEIARLRLLQACERLGIKLELNQTNSIAPDYLPAINHNHTIRHHAFELPRFSLLYHSEAEWKREASAVFEAQCEMVLSFARKRIAELVDSGSLIKVKQDRAGGRVAPIEERYEWAAQRYILNMEYKAIAKGKYNPGQVRQAVMEILKEAKLDAR